MKEDEIGAGDFGRVFTLQGSQQGQFGTDMFLEKVSILVLSKNGKRAIQRSHRQGKKAGGGRKL